MDWVIRAGVSDDEACIASMWLRQLCAGQDAKAAGLKFAAYSNSPEKNIYWGEMQPIITALIRSATVRVACDPERVDHASGSRAVIWGWAVVDDRYVYGAGIKKNAGDARSGIAVELASDLLRKEMPRLAVGEMRTVMDLGDLGRLEMIRPSWQRERGWSSSLRELSRRVIANDSLYSAVASHVVDPQRIPWAPREPWGPLEERKVA